MRDEAMKERAAVVAWLEYLADDCPPIIDKFMRSAARSIRDGDHLTGETEDSDA